MKVDAFGRLGTFKMYLSGAAVVRFVWKFEITISLWAVICIEKLINKWRLKSK